MAAFDAKQRELTLRLVLCGPQQAGKSATLDRLRVGRRYVNRSEFIRDLLRAELVKEEWAEQSGETRWAC